MRLIESALAATVLAGLLTACGGSTAPVALGGDGTTGPQPDTGTGSSNIDASSGYQTTSAPLEYSTVNSGGGMIRVTSGTTATSETIEVNGRSRRYVVLRPTSPAANAPVLLLLHPSATSPETMANITRVADFVQTQGFWAVLPEAIAGSWQDEPTSPGNEDLPFISALIDALIAGGGVDANRFYAAGFSSGGFMTERLACELSDKIAAFGVDSATLRNSLANVCFPATQRPKVYFLGTSDLIVPYYTGIFGEYDNGQRSAAATIDFWVQQQQCNGSTTSVELPDSTADGTTVTLSEYGGCSGNTRLQLYTINGGGHAWPGGESTIFGVTSEDISATGLIWRFVSGYQR